jgi:hypothetical protein
MSEAYVEFPTKEHFHGNLFSDIKNAPLGRFWLSCVELFRLVGVPTDGNPPTT